MKNRDSKLVYMEDFKLNKFTHNQQDISFYELLFDPIKRKAFYKYNDEKYIETEEEREIFETMTKRRK